MNEALTLLDKAIGRRLVASFGEFHYTDGRFDSVPIRVWLEFEGSGIVQIETSSDGESISLTNEYPHPIYMGENYGETAIRNMKFKKVFTKIENTELISYDSLHSPHRSVIGVQLHFGGEENIYLINWGDEIYTMNEIKPSMLSEITVESHGN